MLYLGNYGKLSAAITRRAERLAAAAQLSGRFMQTRESSARGRAALKAKCGHQRDCIFCSQENRKSRPSPVNGLQPPLPRGAVPKCGAQLTGGARRRRICERCLQHQSRRFYCISQPAGARERESRHFFTQTCSSRADSQNCPPPPSRGDGFPLVLGSVWRKCYTVRFGCALRQPVADSPNKRAQIHAQNERNDSQPNKNIACVAGAVNLQCMQRKLFLFVATFLRSTNTDMCQK
jgi:hypothetical protein